jgi:hypothetical protein
MKTEKNYRNLEKNNSEELISTIKKYVNLFKALHHIDPSLAAEFKKKQDHFHLIKHENKKKDPSHFHSDSAGSTGGCCNSKINNKSKKFDK